MNGYIQGSITEKLNKLKSNPSQKPIGTLPFDPSINIVGSMIGKPNQALPISSASSLIPQFTNPAPIAKTNVPIVAKPKPTGIIPPPPAPSIPPEKDQTKNNQNPTEKDQTKNNQNPTEKDQTKNNQNPIIPSPPIEKKKEKDSDTDANFLASLIGQGFAMMGAGIANRDPGQVGQQISQNRAQSEKFASDEEQRKLLNKERLDQIERAKRLLDPQSEESKQKRMTYGKALGLNIPESTTAADLENSDFLRSLMHDKDMQSKMMLENQKLGMRGSGTGGTPKIGKDEAKFNQFQNQVEGFKEQLKRYGQLVKDIPWYDTMGINTQERQKAESLKALLAAQLKDVFTLGTYDSGVQNLVNQITGDTSYTKDATVDAKLNETMNALDRMVESQSKLYNQNQSPVPQKTPYQNKDQALEFIKNNPNDPRSEKIRKILGVK